MLEWDNSPPKTFARANTLKIDPAKLIEHWRSEGVEYDFTRNDWVPENLVFWLKSHPPLQRLNSFRQGHFYIQDPSTLLSVTELAPKAGETILDLCAAPGGKTTFIAQQMGDKGEFVAYDTSAERMKMVQENCARLGVSCVRIVAPDYLDSHPGASFDRVLIDAPCSNTGVIRRRVDLRSRIQPQEIERLQKVQLELLTKAASLLKHGGTLVYSTCSLELEENENVVTQFVASNPWFKVESQRQLLPFRDQVDGAFVARLVKG